MKNILTSLTIALILLGCNTSTTSTSVDAGDASVDVVSDVIDGGAEAEVLMSVMPVQSACVCASSAPVASVSASIASASASAIPAVSASAAPISSK